MGFVLLVTEVRLTAASCAEAQSGLIGYVSCIVNGNLYLDGVTLRRTVDGRLALSFPARTDAAGKRHFYVRPLDDRARRDIEHQVLRALGFEEGAQR